MRTEGNVRSRAKFFFKIREFLAVMCAMRIIPKEREMMLPETQSVPRRGWSPAHRKKICSGLV